MPTISFSKKDFESLIGKRLPTNELRELLDYAKAELDGEDGDTLSVKYNDTNQPYLWCPEGLALLLRGILGKEIGLPKIGVRPSQNTIIVDKSVQIVRPVIAGFLARGPALTDYLLKLLIQLQEKLSENYGRHRENVSIGLYPADKISFPVTFKAVNPESARFVPLDFAREATLAHILEAHPKGKEYGWILAKVKEYPLLVDSKNKVLSFPPIINSETTGRLAVGDKDIFFEATGKSNAGVELCTTIFAHVLAMRGYVLQAVTVKDKQTRICPVIEPKKVVFSKQLVLQRLGIELSDKNIIHHLKRFRYDADDKSVRIPSYRKDIMHPYDIVEDIGISFGYKNIKPLSIHTHTRGAALPEVQFINAVRDVCVGLGLQEVFSAILSNPELLYNKMQLEKERLIEIENYTSLTYSCVRTWILPILLSLLSQNRQAEAPYNIFEEGLVTIRNKEDCHDEHHVAIALCHATANFTEIRQRCEHVLLQLGKQFTIKSEDHPSFISGRCAVAVVNGKKAAFFGELHPKVLQNFGIDLPTVGMEMNLSVL